MRFLPVDAILTPIAHWEDYRMCMSRWVKANLMSFS